MPRILPGAVPLVLLAACGGGGGTPTPATNAPRLVVGDVVVAPGQDRLDLEVRLEGTVVEAALLQFAVVFDSARLGPTSSGPLAEALQQVPTADAEEVTDGRLEVLCGDARNRSPQVLQEGPVLRLHLDTRPPRITGTSTIEVRDLVLVDAAGNDLPATAVPTTATVTFR